MDHRTEGPDMPLLLAPHDIDQDAGPRAREPLLPRRLAAGVRVECLYGPLENELPTGTVTGIRRQHNSCDLITVSWDNDPEDRELYPAEYLRITGTSDTWKSAWAA